MGAAARQIITVAVAMCPTFPVVERGLGQAVAADPVTVEV